MTTLFLDHNELKLYAYEKELKGKNRKDYEAITIRNTKAHYVEDINDYLIPLIIEIVKKKMVGIEVEKQSQPTIEREILLQILRNNDIYAMMESIDQIDLPERLKERDYERAVDIIGKASRCELTKNMQGICQILFKQYHRLGDFKHYQR